RISPLSSWGQLVTRSLRDDENGLSHCEPDDSRTAGTLRRRRCLIMISITSFLPQEDCGMVPGGRGQECPRHTTGLRYAALGVDGTPVFVRCSTKSRIISRLKAGMSLGRRLLTQFWSRTTSLSSHWPPALGISSWLE